MIRYDYNMTAMFLAALTIAALSAHAKPSPYKYVERDPAKKICFAMYTVANETLKLAAQLYPLQEQDSSDIYLEIERNGKWNGWRKAGFAIHAGEGYAKKTFTNIGTSVEGFLECDFNLK